MKVCAGPQGVLLLYTKPGCPLCQGLEKKLADLKSRAAFMQGSVMADLELEVRDISGDQQLEAKYGMSVPVMSWLPEPDSPPEQEVLIARAAPRVSADQLEKHLAKQLQALSS